MYCPTIRTTGCHTGLRLQNTYHKPPCRRLPLASFDSKLQTLASVQLNAPQGLDRPQAYTCTAANNTHGPPPTADGPRAISPPACTRPHAAPQSSVYTAGSVAVSAAECTTTRLLGSHPSAVSRHSRKLQNGGLGRPQRSECRRELEGGGRMSVAVIIQCRRVRYAQ
ncbi:hypothetical protein C2E23DRAFT_437732 [Lenzites betulinus]|nr:hypothetical protein C2E23DRAFT_437732 [Lenzites betulinus]